MGRARERESTSHGHGAVPPESRVSHEAVEQEQELALLAVAVALRRAMEDGGGEWRGVQSVAKKPVSHPRFFISILSLGSAKDRGR
eukprot:scaffold4659_cov125-Isochrysis_galbana.AAC.4